MNDFDPLNENAKEIPPVPTRSPSVLSSAPPIMPKANQIKNPMFAYPRGPPQKVINNLVYEYHQPGQLMNNMRPSSTPSPTPPNPANKEAENELLRRYGLDSISRLNSTLGKTNLNDNASNVFAIHSNRHSNRTIDPFLDNGTNGLKTNGDIQPKSNNNWTTFD